MSGNPPALRTWQGVLCCVLSVLSSLLWIFAATLVAVAINGPEVGDGRTSNLIFGLALPGCGIWVVTLFVTTTFFERANSRKAQQ